MDMQGRQAGRKTENGQTERKAGWWTDRPAERRMGLGTDWVGKLKGRQKMDKAGRQKSM